MSAAHAVQPSGRPPPNIPKRRRRKKKRSPNNVALQPASTEVISNLLASFSAISLPPDEPEYAYADQNPRTPPSTTRPEFAYTNQRIPHLHPKAGRDPSLDLPELRNPYASVSEFSQPDDDNVAEAPVVRTSRPPSIKQSTRKSSWRNRSSPAQQQAERPGSSLSQRARTTQEDEGLRSRLASLTSLTRERSSGFHSPASVLSGRPSFDNRRNDTGRTGSMTAMTLSSGRSGNDMRSDASVSARTNDSRVSDFKGKARTRAVSPVQEVSSHSSRPHSPSRRLPHTISTYSRQVAAPPPANAVGDDTGFIILHPPKTSPTSPTFPFHSRVSSRDGPPSIPSRTASLLHAKPPRIPKSSKSPKKSRGGSSKSTTTSTESPVEEHQVATAVEPSGLQSTSSSETVFLNPQSSEPSQSDRLESQKVMVDPDEDNEVTRRIRELRAANEKRRQDYVEAMPNNTSKAAPPVQLAPRQKVEERTSKVSDGYEDMPPSTIGRNGAMLGLPALESLAPPETDLRGSMSSESRQSYESPATSPIVSRSNSRSKRWSVSDLTKGPSSPEKAHRRLNSKEGTKNTQYPPVIEEGRTSEDSLRDEVDLFLASPKLSRKIPALEDFERQIAFSDVGDPKGHVVFCCLGMGLTRFVTAYYDELASSLGLRLITPDRPGVGDSTAYRDNLKTPLNWPDDIRAICRYLGIEEFSVLAHSAGAIYALATALRMPQRINGNIHLLAPWIPPSQMIPIGASAAADSPTSLPRSQRFLRLLPTSFLKLSNSSLLSSRHAVGGSPKTPNSKSRRSNDTRGNSVFTSPRPSMGGSRHNADHTTSFSLFSSARASGRTSFERQQQLSPLDDIVEVPSDHNINSAVMDAGSLGPRAHPHSAHASTSRQQRYDALLTPAVWELATRKANPAVDLLVCLERNHKIGFRYADISQPVVIHHGSKDARVPLDNVKWLAKTMQRAEVRVLDGEGHGLMASASVIGAVLVEMGKDLDKNTMARVREPLMWD